MRSIINTRTNNTSISNNGMKMTIIEYRKNNDFDVQFEDGTIVNCKRYHSFIEGTIAHPTLRLCGKNVCRGSHIGSMDIEKMMFRGDMPSDVSYLCTCKKCGLQATLTPSEILQHICNNQNTQAYDNTNPKNFCRQLNINYAKAQNYKNLHPELTDEQVIIHFRPDCYINIFGKLVIPDEEDK